MILQLQPEDIGNLFKPVMLEKAVGGVVIHSRFEIAIPYAFRFKVLRRFLQELLTDTFSPVRGIDTEVENHTVRKCAVVRDTEEDKTDNIFIFQVE